MELGFRGPLAGTIAIDKLEVLDFAETEIYEHRVRERNSRQQSCIATTDKVPLVNLLEADDAVDRRVDVTVAEVELGLNYPRFSGRHFGRRSFNGVLN